MKHVLFEDLKAPIKYFPVQVGKATMELQETVSMPPSRAPNRKVFILKYDGLQWCAFEYSNQQELKEQFVEINLAKGKVITTGLGFGLVQSYLCQKKEVTELIVYEQNLDMVGMFKLFAKESNFDISKIKFVHEDANQMRGVECDWLVMDHFEAVHQPDWEILDKVRILAKENKAKNVLFWPMLHFYTRFCEMKKLTVGQDSYRLFVQMLDVKNLPAKLDKKIFEKIPMVYKRRKNY